MSKLLYKLFTSTLVISFALSCTANTLSTNNNSALISTSSIQDLYNYEGEEGIPPTHKTHYTYEGEEGPDKWGYLSPDFKLCKDGAKQTPIDINSNLTIKTKLDPITFSYNASPLKIINNGHTIQVNYPDGSSIKANGKTYKLLQFHFHTPSEHKIDGKGTALEMHLVHKSNDGELAVVGVMLKQGSKNNALQPVWDNLPTEEGPEKTIDTVKLNPETLLPKDRSYYNYSGSLTTPPCTEGVIWLLLKNNVDVSADQVSKFTSIYKLNARPIQPLKDRKVNEIQ